MRGKAPNPMTSARQIRRSANKPSNPSDLEPHTEGDLLRRLTTTLTQPAGCRTSTEGKQPQLELHFFADLTALSSQVDNFNMILRTLFPDVRAEVIRCLFDDPRREIHVRELARLTTLALRTVQRELGRLSKGGFVLSRSNGYHRFYRANSDHKAFAALQQLVRKDGRRRRFVSRHKRPRRSPRRRRTKHLQSRPTFMSSFGVVRSIR